jgi:hypothetical protein
MTQQLYVGCDMTDKSPMAWHTGSPINSALSQETTMLRLPATRPLIISWEFFYTNDTQALMNCNKEWSSALT